MKNSAAAILAGGKSTRLGFDKALLKIDNQFLLDRIFNEISGITAEIIVIGDYRPESLIDPAFFVQDLIPGLGPLGGLYTALKWLGKDLLLLSCDMPGIKAAHISALSRYSAHDYQAVVGSGPKGLEPLFALYKTSCLPALEMAIKNHDYALYRIIAKLKVKYVDYREVSEDPDIFFNINTLSDYKKVLYLKSRTQE